METLIRLLVIGSGGFVGAILRYLVSGWVQVWSGSILFPFGTMAVNLIGCFVIGFLSFLVESRGFLSVETRSFLLIGLLGAFTTFSTFGNETLTLVRNGRMDLAAINATSQVLIGLVMVWLGRVSASGIWR
ncbi:fluoride efflux transporter CrcB [Thermodesulfobacteriota bacterium B35]